LADKIRLQCQKARDRTEWVRPGFRFPDTRDIGIGLQCQQQKHALADWFLHRMSQPVGSAPFDSVGSRCGNKPAADSLWPECPPRVLPLEA